MIGRLYVRQCLFNDLRSGDRQWTLVLASHDGSGEVRVYSTDEVPAGTPFELVAVK